MDLRHRPPQDLSTLETYGDEARERLRDTDASNRHPRVRRTSTLESVRRTLRALLGSLRR
jgi:hypothetical protein